MQNPLAALIQDKIVSLAGSSTSQLAKDILAMHPADLVCTSDLAFKAVDIHKSNCHIHFLSSHDSRKILQKKTYKKYASKYLLVERNLFSVFAKNFRLFSKLKNIYFYRDEYSLGGTTYYCFENKKNPELSSLIYSNLSAAELSAQIKEKHFLTLHAGQEPSASLEIVFESLGPETVKALLGKKFSNRQIRLFSLSGIDGYAFNSAPYYFPKLAKQALEEATLGDDGIMYPAADTRLQLLAFHMLFHGEQFANLDDISSSKYFGELAILAQQSGQPCPVNIAQLEKRLHESGHFPSRDLIGFYSRNNPFVTQQYLRKEFKPGLATLFIRDFPEQIALHESIKNYLRKHFQVVAEGPITNELGTMVADQIRGGNWFVNQMAGEAPPIYWFVCYDSDPQRVTKKIARNYPTCDNMRIVTSKRHLRSLARDDAGETVRIVHASDNSDDAYENVRILGLEDNENIKRVVADLRHPDV